LDITDITVCLEIDDIILLSIWYLVDLITHFYLGYHLQMIVRRCVATFVPIMHFVLWRHCWKGEGKIIYPTLGYQHVRLSYGMKYEQRHSLFDLYNLC